MNEVKAVKDKHTIETIKREFDGLYGEKVSSIWELGLQLALRISDLLSIKYGDIDLVGERVKVTESKTNKVADIKLNAKAIAVIESLRASNPDDVYLFQATGNRVAGVKPFSRQYITKCFKVVSESLKVEIGTHSMRKTRGYWMYKQSNDLARVMRMLRHSSVAVTLRYIGITQEEVDNDFDDLEL